jgi:hypothetical protein
MTATIHTRIPKPKPTPKHRRKAPKEDPLFLGVRRGDRLIFFCHYCRHCHIHSFDRSAPDWSLWLKFSHCKHPASPPWYWIGIAKEMMR